MTTLPENPLLPDVVEVMAGKTVAKIEGARKGSEEIKILMEDGTYLLLFHGQSCCETVEVEDVIGDPDDFISQPLTLLEERSGESPSGFDENRYESFTWTFYEIQCPKGSLTIRWLGYSNGYYSEKISYIYFDGKKKIAVYWDSLTESCWIDEDEGNVY